MSYRTFILIVAICFIIGTFLSLTTKGQEKQGVQEASIVEDGSKETDISRSEIITTAIYKGLITMVLGMVLYFSMRFIGEKIPTKIRAYEFIGVGIITLKMSGLLCFVLGGLISLFWLSMDFM